MRPVRFVALSEDGQSFVLADEVGRLLALPIDDRVSTALRLERPAGVTAPAADGGSASLSPRDIQARIRAGESADDVARVAGVPVDRVLRYAGPVLQERAMLAQHARRTKLRSSAKGATLAEVVDARLGQHGIDAEKISWDAYRRDDGTWRVIARWPSGKATAQALWELDKARQNVTPHDDMAQYLCAERPAPGSIEAAPPVPGRGDPRYDAVRGGHEPMRPASDTARRDRPGRGLGPAEPLPPAALDQSRHRPDPLRPDRHRPDGGRLRPDPLRPDATRPDGGRLRPDPLRPDATRPGGGPLRPDPLRPDATRPDAGRPAAPDAGPAQPGVAADRGDDADAGRGDTADRATGPADPMAPAALDQGRRRPDPLRPDARPGSGRPDPIRSGRDALLASLERPLGAPRDATAGPEAPAASSAGEQRRARGAAALIGAPVATTSPYEDDAEDTPAVPSLAVLRPRLKSHPDGPATAGDKPRKRLPSWDDVLFGGAPARESS
jgi:hypothetical protein